MINKRWARTCVAVLALTGVVAVPTAALRAQDSDSVVRLRCEGIAKISHMGFNATPDKSESMSLGISINTDTGYAQTTFSPLARLFSVDGSPYVFAVRPDSFVWSEERRAKDDPITATSTIRIDRYSGAMMISEAIVSSVAGKEYIHTKNIEAGCTRLTRRQF